MARNAAGVVLSGVSVGWSSTNVLAVTITSAGYATAVGPGVASIVATIGGKSNSVQVTVLGNPTPPPGDNTVASISVVPGSATSAVGDGVQFIAVARNAAGSALSGVAINWWSTNQGVLSITPAGFARGVAPGESWVVALAGGKSSSVPYNVTAAVPLPGSPPPDLSEPMPTFGTILVRDAFDALLDAALLAPYEPMQNALGLSVFPSMHADPGAGLNGSGALRMDEVRSTTCHDDSRGFTGYLPGAPTEYYVQFSVKYQPGYIWDWINSGQTPCTGTASKIFRTFTGQSGTLPGFFFENEGHMLHAGSDWNDPRWPQDPAGPVMSLAQLADGNWHRFTFHIKQSSTDNGNDGFFYGWLDGVRRWTVTRWSSGTAQGPAGYKVGGTFNQGFPANQSSWVDNFAIWKP